MKRHTIERLKWTTVTVALLFKHIIEKNVVLISMYGIIVLGKNTYIFSSER